MQMRYRRHESRHNLCHQACEHLNDDLDGKGRVLSSMHGESGWTWTLSIRDSFLEFLVRPH